MQELYYKLAIIIGELLCYSKSINSITKPTFNEKEIVFIVRNKNDISKEISIPYSAMTKVHDHLLETYILSLFRENDLL